MAEAVLNSNNRHFERREANSEKNDRKPSFFQNLRKGLRKIFNVEGRVSRRKEKIPTYKAGVEDGDLSTAERAVRRASSWDELYDAAKLITHIPTSSGGRLSAHDIQQRINSAYYSEDPQRSANLIPRIFGLRNKYLQLLKRTYDERPIHRRLRELVFQGATGVVKLRDPEKYHSKSVDTAMKKITQLMEAQGLTIQENKLEAAKIAAEVVNLLMPYDHQGLKENKVSADQAGSVTEIIEIHKVGVCRHQAPLLVAVLKKMGFDAQQVSHKYRNARYGHTLAYISDPEVAAFVNPGWKEDKWTVMPYRQYGQQNRGGMYGAAYDFTFRTSSNRWRSFDYRL